MCRSGQVSWTQSIAEWRRVCELQGRLELVSVRCVGIIQGVESQQRTAPATKAEKGGPLPLLPVLFESDISFLLLLGVGCVVHTQTFRLMLNLTPRFLSYHQLAEDRS